MATFNPGPIDQPRTFRACCSGPGGVVYSPQFVVTPSEECDATACQIVSQPQSVSGTIGDLVNLGGAASGAASWETAPTVNGPWAAGIPPTTITASSDGTFWRLCCVDDPTVCSQIVSITATGVDCDITSQPQNVFGQIGDPVNFGGTASAPVQWETSGSPTGPWVNATPPASITAANLGTFWRFCCIEDPTICSDVVSIQDSGSSPTMSRTDTDGVWDTTQAGDPTEEFCVNNCGGVITWEIRVDDPVDPPAGWVSNQGWTPLPDWNGQQCVQMSAPNRANLIESQPSLFDPTTVTGETDLDHTMTFEIRGLCDGVPVQAYTVEIPYDHIDEGTIP